MLNAVDNRFAAGLCPQQTEDMPSQALSKKRRVGNTARLAVPRRRLEIQLLERADRQWEISTKKKLAQMEHEWKGDPDEWWYARLKATCELMPTQPQGFQERRRKCVRCGSAATYSERYDARFCGQCNRWLESACGDPACPYCGRPKRPLPRKTAT